MRLLAALLLLAAGLAGCSDMATITGIAVGGAAGGATANPVVGYAVAVGTDAAADYAFKYFGRSRQHAEQQAIAAAAGTLQPGQTAPWRIDHTIPFGNEHGNVQVVSEVDTTLAPCRRIVFSVEQAKKPPAWFDANVCRDAQGWSWASAEPAVERWGYLQ